MARLHRAWMALLAIIDRLRLREAVVLAVLLLIVLSVWGFIELADEVLEGDTQAFDTWVVRSMRRANDPSIPIGPAWLVEWARDITALGSTAVLLLMVGAVAGYLALQRKFHAMWFIIIAAATGALISQILKNAFGRQRPEVVPYLAEVFSPAFPSGHAMVSSVVYLTLGVLLMRLISDWRTKVYLLCLALMLPMIVGITRVYLGVHYPTDVLGGWAAGLAWALLCWLVASYLQRHG